MTIDIDAIRQREQAATPGPWIARDGHPFAVWQKDDAYLISTKVSAEPAADAEFIAHARTDVPALLAKVDELTAALDDLRARHAAMDHALTGLRAEHASVSAENARLREQIFAQQPVIDAAEAWAEMREIGGDAPGDTRKIEDALHGAIEQHRLMDLALTAAHGEAAERDKCRDIYPGQPIIGGAPLCHRGCGIPVWRHAATTTADGDDKPCCGYCGTETPIGVTA